MTFRIETITDCDKIEQVLLMFDNSFPRPLSERLGNLRNYAIKLAESAVVDTVTFENKIAGFSAYYCNDTSGKQAFLTQIAVAGSYRGMSIGNILLETCIETSRQKGMERLILEVDDDNVAALKLYAKYGFTNMKKASECSHLLVKNL